MAKSKKAARNIVVDGVRYRWRATGNDDWISLVVWPDDLPGAAIACSFDYRHIPVALDRGITALTGQLVITNRIVRRIINHAVREHGYDAHAKGKQLNLRRVDEIVDVSGAVRAK